MLVTPRLGKSESLMAPEIHRREFIPGPERNDPVQEEDERSEQTQFDLVGCRGMTDASGVHLRTQFFNTITKEGRTLEGQRVTSC